MTKELLQQCLDALLPHSSSHGNSWRAVEDAAIEALKQALAQQEPNPWADAVIDQLVVHHIYQAAHDTDPRKAVKDLLGISNSIALDPQVSSDAQALIDRGRKEAQQEQPASVDAYVGAREDAAIWKKRALEAEELNRKFIAEVNGPTYLGEPAQQEQPAQEASATWTEMVVANLVREGVNKHRARELAAHFLTLPTQPAQEPVGFTSEESIRALKESGVSVQVYASRGTWFDEPLYTRPAPAMPTHEAIYETIINWDEGGKRSRRELARRIEALYTHSVPTQPALSDKQILDIFGKVSADGMGHYMTAVGRAIEAHCRGGASHE